MRRRRVRRARMRALRDHLMREGTRKEELTFARGIVRWYITHGNLASDSKRRVAF